jgi:signal transduction histidine kinase
MAMIWLGMVLTVSLLMAQYSQAADATARSPAHLAEPQVAIPQGMEMLQKNMDHIKGIVAMQQRNARVTGGVEVLSVANLIEDIIRIHAACEIAPLPPLKTDRHKVMQILMNLLIDAKHARGHSEVGRRMAVRATRNQEGWLEIAVLDNGTGIPPENSDRIFSMSSPTKSWGTVLACIAARWQPRSWAEH